MGKSSTKAKNKYNLKTYERIILNVPIGKKDEYKAKADSLCMSLNGYIIDCIESNNHGNDFSGILN